MFFIVVSTFVIFILYLLISSYYLKRRRNIKDKRNWMFAEGRKKYFVIVDIAIIVLFMSVIVYLITTYENIDFSPYIVTGLLSLLSASQGIEELIFHRTEKVYYYRFLTSITFLILMFTFVIGGRLI